MSGAREIDWAAARARLELAQRAIEGTLEHSPGELRALLDRRAALLALPLAEAAAEPRVAIVIFRVGEDRYGIRLRDVAEVVADPRIAPAPGAAEGVRGFVQLRGEVRVVWFLTRLLGLPRAAEPPSKFLLVVRGDDREIAICADEVDDIRDEIDAAGLTAFRDQNKSGAQRRLAAAPIRHLDWMTEDLVSVLDTGSLIAATAEAS